MSLSDKDIQHIAKLSSLAIDDSQLETFRDQLNSILEHVNSLSSVSTKGVVATSHVHGAVNAFRDDVVKESLTNEEGLSNAPNSARGSFRVPKII